jgi:hypothetical protein
LHLTNQHKALLITFFLSGTVVMSVFNLNLKKHNELASESYYEMEPEKEMTEEEVKILESLENQNNTKPETNSAFNETADNKQFAQAYKPIAPPEDYEYPKPSENNDDGDSDNSSATGEQKPVEPRINKEELSSFSKVKDLLKKQQAESVNTKSTISFSLVDRKKIYIPIPVYLCEVDGRIVINITVNDKGDVVDAYVNTSSTSDNECLIGHAIEYAKQSQFSADPSKKKQLGSITFHFIGKG